MSGKCEKCNELGLRSTVDAGGTTSTLMGGRNYYDEDGKWHSHDPNWRTTTFRCSRGHAWAEGSRDGCSACGTPPERKISRLSRLGDT